MKKIKILLLLVLFSVNYNYASDSNDYIMKANEYKLAGEFSKAIRFYSKAIKKDKSDQLVIKNVYFEIADCFLQQGKYRMAIRVMKSSVYNFGASMEDINKTEILDKDFKQKALKEIEPNYNKYRRKYIARLDNVDDYLEKNNIVLR